MTTEERFEAFLKQLKESNQFVKENVMCYFYFNTSCCSQCPKRIAKNAVTRIRNCYNMEKETGMKKTLICLRGAPGSGKTTLAKELQKGFTKNEGATAHWEADMYFTSEDGTYKFDPKLLPVAHEWCRNKVRDSLKNCPLVIVSNTSIRRSDVEAYKEIAKEAGAEFKVFLVVGNFQNVHKVPDETVKEMRRKYEEYPGEGKYYRGGGK